MHFKSHFKKIPRKRWNRHKDTVLVWILITQTPCERKIKKIYKEFLNFTCLGLVILQNFLYYPHHKWQLLLFAIAGAIGSDNKCSANNKIYIVVKRTHNTLKNTWRAIVKFRLTSIATAIILSPAAFAADMEDIERLTVEGKYLSVNQSNSIKSPTPIIDVPQSLSIMTAEEITARGITSVGQIIDYTPGVNTSH